MPARRPEDEYVAPTPQNTPLQNQPLTRDLLSRPTVGTVTEEDEEAAAANAPNEAIAAAMAGNPALAALLGDRLGRLSAPGNTLNQLPDPVRRRALALEGLQARHLEVEFEFQKELMEIERAFQAKYKPLYDQRKDIVLGRVEPAAELVVEGEEAKAKRADASDEKKESLAQATAPADGQKGIPFFWLTALRTHTALSEIITSRDEKALESLQDIRCEQLPAGGPAGYKLTFEFDPANTFFKNATLTKTYYYREKIGPNGDLIYDHAEGTPIQWISSETDLTTRVESKKQRNKNTNQVRTVKRTVPTESFFNFFSPPVPRGEEDESDDGDEELEERLAMDYQLGEDIKDRIVPHAIQFFTGEALEYENFDDDIDAFDEEEEEEEDDDDAPAPATQGATAQSADPQECRQQ